MQQPLRRRGSLVARVLVVEVWLRLVRVHLVDGRALLLPESLLRVLGGGELGLGAVSVEEGAVIALYRLRVDASRLLLRVDRLALLDDHHFVEGLDDLLATLHQAEVILLHLQRVPLRAHDSTRQDVVAHFVVTVSVKVAKDLRDRGLVLIVVAQSRRVRNRRALFFDEAVQLVGFIVPLPWRLRRLLRRLLCGGLPSLGLLMRGARVAVHVEVLVLLRASCRRNELVGSGEGRLLLE